MCGPCGVEGACLSARLRLLALQLLVLVTSPPVPLPYCCSTMTWMTACAPSPSSSRTCPPSSTAAGMPRARHCAISLQRRVGGAPAGPDGLQKQKCWHELGLIAGVVDRFLKEARCSSVSSAHVTCIPQLTCLLVAHGVWRHGCRSSRGGGRAA